MSRMLIFIGVIFVLLGVFWFLIVRLPFGKMPGDLSFTGEHFKVYVPITTSIIVSLLLSFLIWAYERWK